MEKWADLLLFESSRKVPNLALLALFLQSLCPHFTIPWKRSDAVIYAVNKWTYMWSNFQDISKMTEAILNLLDDKLNLNELNMSFSSLLTKQIYPSMDPRLLAGTRTINFHPLLCLCSSLEYPRDWTFTIDVYISGESSTYLGWVLEGLQRRRGKTTELIRIWEPAEEHMVWTFVE